MKQEITVYKALDFLFCEPDNPVYEDLKNEKGEVYCYRIASIIKVCNQHSFVTARKPTEQESYGYTQNVLLVYGKYPVPEFLLQPVGKIICH